MNPLSVAEAAAAHPERLALVGDGPPLSFAALADAVRARAPAPAALTPDGSREATLDVLAALGASRPLALLHPRWTEPERAAAAARFEAHAEPGDVVVFTSGSSGRPKGVRLKRTALVAAARAHAAALPFEDGDRWLLTLPLAHVGGLSVLTRCLVARACVALGPTRFDPTGLVEAVARERVTLLSLVPTMLARLMDAGAPPPTLRAVLLGGAAASPALVRQARAAGWPVLPTYGASETCGQVCTQRLDEPRPTGVGPPLPTLHVRSTQSGDIEISGPTLMAGYLDDPSPLRDGWFRTGDRGRLDDHGHLHVLGRRDAMLISGGENVDPAEVEMALESHPSVRRAFVTGLPDPEWGQRVVALVVGEVELAPLRAHLTPRLAAFKHPRAVVAVTALPDLPSGKLDRLGAQALAERSFTERQVG